MKRVILQGKVWEVRHLLKMYAKKYTYVYEWINDLDHPQRKTAKIYQFPKQY